LIGVGGVGFVVAATHIGLDGDVALKFLKPEFAAHPEAVHSFMLEARASFRIKNEHVARVLDVSTLPNGLPFMVMDLLEGEDLRRILGRHRVLPIDVAVDLVLQTCEALAAAHASDVVHRDIKPENLFVTGLGYQDHVKVLDFGISKIAFSSNTQEMRAARAATMVSVGTPPYMSPEQIRGSSNLDARADQWSLGCVLYELLTGIAPFARMSLMQACAAVLEDEPPPLRENCPQATPELEQALMRCLRKKPADRFDHIAELAWALAPFGQRYVHCAQRCSDMRSERPGSQVAVPSAVPQLSRSRALRTRIPTTSRLPVTTTPVSEGTVQARRPTLESIPVRRETAGVSIIRSGVHPIAAVSEPLAALPPPPPPPSASSHSAGNQAASGHPPNEVLTDDDISFDDIQGLRPPRTGWILVGFTLVAALVATYLASTQPEQRGRSRVAREVAPLTHSAANLAPENLRRPAEADVSSASSSTPPTR
jgi:serine/threonine-protein kinase